MDIFKYMEEKHKEGKFKVGKKGRNDIEYRLFIFIDSCLKHKKHTEMTHPIIGLHGKDDYNDSYNVLYFYILSLLDAKIINMEIFNFILKSVK